jgi:hypothetical protein
VPGARLTPDLLSRARTLFARAIETPGGLKIQTIHSFCASVLRRFPLEAGVSPGFTEIDERVQGRLIADLLDEIAEDPARRMPSTPWCRISATRTASRSFPAPSPGGRTPSIRRWIWDGVAQAMGIDPGLDDAVFWPPSSLETSERFVSDLARARSRNTQLGTLHMSRSPGAVGGDDARRYGRDGSRFAFTVPAKTPAPPRGPRKGSYRKQDRSSR